MTKQRYYHRFIRKDDLGELEEASSYLFAFDPHEVSLEDVIGSDRWFCLAAVSATSSGERIVGFVAAALGSINEFPQEQQYLEATLQKAASSNASSSGVTDAAFPTASAPNQPTTSQTITADVPVITSSSSSNNNSNSSSVNSLLAVEVVLLGVVPEFRRKGVASRLLKQVRTHAKTKGASLMFLHVQTTNTPARQLYQKFGFTSAAVLPGYYSFRHGVQLQQQQQQQELAAAAATRMSVWGCEEFSGTDAELLVMQVAKNTVQATNEAAAAAVAEAITPVEPAATGRSSSSSSSHRPSAMHRMSSNSDCARGGADIMSSHTSSSSSSMEQSIDTPAAPATAAAATEAVTAAAAAAARLLLGPAIGLLGLAGRGSSSSRKGGKFFGKRGELIAVGDGEYLVQVREGSNVFVYDPDELPEDVVLSNRDKAVLQQQQQRQQRQQDQTGDDTDHNDDDADNNGDQDDDDDDHEGGGSRLGVWSRAEQQQEQQQQQQESFIALPLADSQQQQQQQNVTPCQIGYLQEQQQQQQWRQWPTSPLSGLQQWMVSSCQTLQQSGRAGLHSVTAVSSYSYKLDRGHTHLFQPVNLRLAAAKQQGIQRSLLAPVAAVKTGQCVMNSKVMLRGCVKW